MDDQINDNLKVESAEVETKENAVNEVKPVEHIKEKRRGKEERNRRKDDKRPAEQFLKGLNDVHSIEDKLEVMCKKYSELVNENRKLQMVIKQYDKKILSLQREKEQFQSERSKATLARRKLETLCRELQKQNKAVKKESLLKLRQHEEKSKELTEKFQGSLAQITALSNLNTKKGAMLYEQNLEMNEKFKATHEHLKQGLLKALEETKHYTRVVKMEATAEKEALLKEKQQLLCKLAEYQIQIRELQATEVALRSQISMYTDKYDEFQNALTRSNKVYGEFNEEMEKMSKKILTLEKETSLWKQRWESSHAALLEMATDKQVKDKEMATLSRKLSLLQDLCKVFQCERTDLIAQLKKKNSGESNMSAQVDEENSKSVKKVDKLSKDCSKLQDTLSKVSEVIEKGIEDKTSEKDTTETKEDTEMHEKDLETSNDQLENKEIKRLEALPLDANNETSKVEQMSEQANSETNQSESLEIEKQDNVVSEEDLKTSHNELKNKEIERLEVVPVDTSNETSKVESTSEQANGETNQSESLEIEKQDTVVPEKEEIGVAEEIKEDTEMHEKDLETLHNELENKKIERMEAGPVNTNDETNKVEQMPEQANSETNQSESLEIEKQDTVVPEEEDLKTSHYELENKEIERLEAVPVDTSDETSKVESTSEQANGETNQSESLKIEKQDTVIPEKEEIGVAEEIKEGTELCQENLETSHDKLENKEIERLEAGPVNTNDETSKVEQTSEQANSETNQQNTVIPEKEEIGVVEKIKL